MAASSVNYPYPSGVNVADFVNVKVSPVNYNIWKPMMLDLLKNNGLIGFIDGSITPPEERVGEAENPDFLEWAKSDGLVRRWILSTVFETDLIYLHHLPTAKEMWIAIQRGSNKPFYHEIKIDHIGTGTNLSKYIPLSTAALNGDWAKAKEFLDKEPEAVKAYITGASETALMIAARSVDRINFFSQLLEKMDPLDAALCNKHGTTALHIAAASGNIKAAKLLVEKNPLLPNIFDQSLILPLHIAAIFCEKQMVLYLLSVTKDNPETKLFEGESGNKLMHSLVESGLYDVALDILKKRPQLACEEPTPFGPLSMKRSSFKSGLRLSFYQRFIYTWVPLKMQTDTGNNIGSVNNNTTSSSISVKQKLTELFWEIAEILVPQMRSIQEAKTINFHALELVKGLCSEIVKLEDSKASTMLGVPVKTASCIGIHEIIEEILASFPSAIYLTDEMNRTLFHLAIINRRENIFNIVYQIEHKHVFLRMQDRANNNCLHLVGSLESQQKLNLRDSAAGAALQVQRELQWFKAVEQFILKQDNEQRNIKGQTPAMVFTETHESLVKEGEQWMKDTSNSCTIVGALIVTIVFAAAITVPGGNNGDNGIPIFYPELAFRVFAVADALALFASTSSVLMFLSILTSRYGEEDFLYALPKRLIIGLGTLFLSIIFMMIAFGATIQIVFGKNRPWILIPVVAFSCVPVMLFMSLQFPLLWVMIKSTYGPGIFGKQSNRILF